MNKTFLIAWVAVFVAWMAGSFVVHGLLLNDYYAQLPNLFRTETETQALSHFMLIGHIIMAGAFVWIYQRGINSRAWLGQGLRFGIAIALLAPIPSYMIYYVVQPMTGALVVGQAIGDSLLVIVLAVLTAFISRNTRPG